MYCPVEKWNAKAIVKGSRETGQKLLSMSMANGTAYLSHISDLPSKYFCVQGENSHKHLFFSMASSIGLIVTRSQKPSSCLCVCVCESPSHVRLFAAPWTVAGQASLSMEFSRQEYWSALPFPSPEDLPSPGIEPWSPAYSLPFELQGSPPAIWFLPYILIINIIMFTSLSPHLHPHTPKNTYLCNKGLIQNSLCLANNRIINSSCCALTEVWKFRSKRTENGRFKSTMRLKLECPILPKSMWKSP